MPANFFTSGAMAMLGDVSRQARGLGAIALSLAKNRLELFSVELAEEKARTISAMVWAALGLLFALLGLVLLTFTVVYLLAEPARTWALAGFTAFYLLAAAVCLLVVRAKLRSHPAPFEQTIGEFAKDREALG